MGQEGPLEKEIATHSSILAWEIPWMEESDRLQSMGSQRVGHDWATSFTSLYRPPSSLLILEFYVKHIYHLCTDVYVKELKVFNKIIYMCISCSALSDSASPWTVAHHATLSMGFSRQEYWKRLLFPSPRDFPDPGINPGLPPCRQILYRLSHQGNPNKSTLRFNITQSHRNPDICFLRS